MLLKLLTYLLPWPWRRRVLNGWFGYQIHPLARIGWAWVFPRQLVLAAGARIDHFTVAIHLDRLEMGTNAFIGRSNWITGFPTRRDSPHFQHQVGRPAELIMGEEANITKQHHLDCTNRIEVGPFATIAGYQSQFLTHSINLAENRQDSAPICIGAYTFVGTNVVVLGGSVLPSYSVLGAKSLLNKTLTEEWTVYGGIPAVRISSIDRNTQYFHRAEGYVL
jgi:acetyltransferase-like isoleucine patch superfamily enzyme